MINSSVPTPMAMAGSLVVDVPGSFPARVGRKHGTAATRRWPDGRSDLGAELLKGLSEQPGHVYLAHADPVGDLGLGEILEVAHVDD